MGNLLTPKSDNWISLPSLPLGSRNYCECNCVPINNTEFITAVDTKDFYNQIPLHIESKKGIYLYNIVNNKWKLFLNLSELNEYKGWTHGIGFDSHKNILYLFSQNNQLLIYDRNTKQFKIHSFNTLNVQFAQNNQKLAVICVNSVFHIIGGQSFNSHAIWNENTQIFERQSINQSMHRATMGTALIYRKYRNELYVLGGYINEFKTGSRQFKYLDEIYVHKLGTKQWNPLNIKIPNGLHSAGSIIVHDRYIILFGGYTVNVEIQAKSVIYVLDLQKMNFLESCIKCPGKDRYRVVLMCDYVKNDMIVYGFVRSTKQAFGNVFPNEIIALICDFYQIEYVHLISMKSGKHWKINVEQIINHCRTIKFVKKI
eukprot:115320_1